MSSKKKKFSETNEQIRERLKYQLDGTKEFEIDSKQKCILLHYNR